MYKKSKFTRISVALLLTQLALSSMAQESTEGTLGDWRALDEDFRQTMVEQMSIDRGLDPNDQNPDWLIDSVEDIAEALYLSCDISGACADQSGRDTLGANLITFPDYDEEQGLRNAEAILRMKTGHED